MPPKKKTTKGRTTTTTATNNNTITRRKTTKAPRKTGTKRKSPTPSSSTTKTSSTTSTSTSTSASSGATVPLILLPPSLIGRPLPTLILDSGGWTIKHDIIYPSTSAAASTSGEEESSKPHNCSTRNINTSTCTSARTVAAPTPPKQSYNVIAKPKHVLTTLISNEINTIQNKSNLIFKRPLERGYTTDLGVQFQIWDYILSIENLECKHSFSNGGVSGGVLSQSNTTVKGGTTKGGGAGVSSSSNRASPMPGGKIYTHTAAVVCLHQPFTPRNLLEKEDDIFFRDFGFGRVHRILGVCCSAFEYLRLVKEKKTKKEKKESIGGGGGGGDDEDDEKKKNVFGCTILDDDDTGCCCVIDSGFSLTHVVPTVDARAITKGIRRINIGGKLLTNLLKEIVSYRQWNMRDEFYNINDAKEALCFLSTQFEKDLKYAREESRTACRRFDREFVLPDYTETFQGSVRIPLRLQMIMEEEERRLKKEMEGVTDDDDDDEEDEEDEDYVDNNDTSMDVDNDDDNEDEEEDADSDNETEDQIRKRLMKQREAEKRQRELEEEQHQALLLSVERFTVPEILFRPSDIQMKQLGLAETIVQSIEACDPVYHAAMYHNVVLTGGNVRIPYFKERLEVELRSIAPINYKIRVYVPDDPISFAFQGAQNMVRNDGFTTGVDRAQWEMKKQGGEVVNLWKSSGLDGSPEGQCTI